MPTYREHHGISVVDGTFIENLQVEQLTEDPSPLTAGRQWVNTTEKLYKFSTLNQAGAVITRSFATAEDLASEISTLNTNLTSYVDTEVANVQSQITNLGNAFNYVGVLSGGTAATPGDAFDLDSLAPNGQDPGDYYKVDTAGFFQYDDGGSPAYIECSVNDGLVKNNAGGWDKLDNTNSSVAAGSEITVTGSTETGFTVSVAASFITSVSDNTTAIAAETTRAEAAEGNLASLATSAQGSLVAAINEVHGEVDANAAAISTEVTRAQAAEGNLATLDTTEKGSLVGAVNEVHGEVDTNTTNIGTIGNLATTATNLVAAVNEIHGEVDANASAISTNATNIGTIGNLATAATNLVAAINEVHGEVDANASAISTNATNIGTIGNLATTATNLVAAVNELHTEINANTAAIATADGEIGDLSSLATTEQGSLVGAINEIVAAAGDGAASLKTAINAQRSIYTASSAATTHSHNHGLTGENITCELWVKDTVNNVWVNDSAAVTMDPATTTVSVDMGAARIVKLIVEDKTAIA